MKKIFIFLFFAFIGISNISGATFTSVSSGTWSTPATWSRVGVDSDGIPDQDDDVTINTGHSIIMTSVVQSVKSMINNGTIVGNSKKFYLYGNFTNNGNVSNVVIYVQSACVFSSSVFFSGAVSWWVYNNLTISAGTSVYSPNTMAIFSTVNNLGAFSVQGGLSLSTNGKWINGAASTLTLTGNITSTGTLDASAVGNTVTYQGTLSKQIKNSTYYNLTLLGASSTTRTALGNLDILNNLTIGSATGHVFNMNNFNLTVGGNWLNQSNSNVINQGNITFNSSGTQTITRSTNEVINNMILSGTGTVLLGTSITVSNNLTINSGTLDLSASNYTANVAGDLVNNGSINARNGLFNFNGVTAKTISGSSSTNFYNVTSANIGGISITGNVTISNVLRVNSGAFGTSGAGVITIPATGSTTYGRIASVGGSLTGTGWRVESYINGPAPKGWQWLSSPISGNTLADWDNDSGFYMSGVGGNDGNAGSFKSVRTYSEATGLYTNVTATNTALTAGKGFHIWMADDLSNGLTTPRIYNSVGTPNFGTINFPITEGGVGGGYNLVGNPYACPITYSTVVAASGNLYSSFVILLEDNSYSYDANGGIIAPNQGFMCVADASGNIVFTEAAKNIVSNPNILKTAAKNDVITFSVYNNINGTNSRTNIEFSNNVTDNFDKGKDLHFLASPSDDADNIYTKSTDNIPLLKNMLMNNGEDKRVPLTVKSGVYGIHHISVKGLSSLTNYNSIWLDDPYSGKRVDLIKEQGYDFNADEVGKEFSFTIHFSNNKKIGSIKETITTNILNENTSVYNTPSNVIVKFGMIESTPVKISVYSLTGQQVIEPMNLNVTDDRIALPLQKENGMYLLLIQSKDQQIIRKIIY